MMKEISDTFFSGKFTPITFSIGFLQAEIGVVCSALYNWKKSIYRSVEMIPFQADLTAALDQFDELINPPKRELLISTKSEWTAYFNNGLHGTDPFGPISYLSMNIGVLGLTVRAVPHTLNVEEGSNIGTYGSWQFELFSSRKRDFLNYERSISVTFDGGRWVFVCEGNPQDFEDLRAYKRHKIRERFGFSTLISYCKALGLDVNNPSFYSDRCCLISIKDVLRNETKPVSIYNAQTELGLRQAL